MASNEKRGHKGDFIATIARQDPKDLKLRAVLSKYLEYTLGWFSIIFEALFPMMCFFQITNCLYPAPSKIR